MPQFSRDWFSDNIPVWEAVLAHLKGKPNLRFLEIGTFEGRSALWLMENILTDPSSRLDCVDTFEGSYEHGIMGMNLTTLEEVFRFNLALFMDRIGVYRGPSSEMLFHPEIRAQGYDFVYVDGCHEAKEVLEDAVLGFTLLKPGGLIVLDDYNWGPHQTMPLITPKPAVDVFTACYTLHMDVLHTGEQVVAQKRSKRIGALEYAAEIKEHLRRTGGR